MSDYHRGLLTGALSLFIIWEIDRLHPVWWLGGLMALAAGVLSVIVITVVDALIRRRSHA
jgi:hypothetical protein